MDRKRSSLASDSLELPCLHFLSPLPYLQNIPRARLPVSYQKFSEGVFLQAGPAPGTRGTEVSWASSEVRCQRAELEERPGDLVRQRLGKALDNVLEIRACEQNMVTWGFRVILWRA